MFSSHSQKMPKKPATGGIVNIVVPNMSQAAGSAGDIVVPNMSLTAGSAGDIVTMAPPIDFSSKVVREVDAELTSDEGRAARRSLMRGALMIGWARGRIWLGGFTTVKMPSSVGRIGPTHRLCSAICGWCDTGCGAGALHLGG